MWVFGYGSLIWKADFPYETKVPGFIRGHVRRFWQGSHDHRGTPENPGRVCTLISRAELDELEKEHHREECENHEIEKLLGEEEDEEGRYICWGVAYKVAEKDIAMVKAQLDHRERNGYTEMYMDVFQHGKTEPVVQKALVYVGASHNEAFLGPGTLEKMAEHIYLSHGSSGANSEYLLNLAVAMRELAPDARDPHMYGLERRVKAFLSASRI